MITKFKLYEQLDQQPKIGDLVILEFEDYYPLSFNKFCSKNVGKIISTTGGGIVCPYEILFNKIPDKIYFNGFGGDPYDNDNITGVEIKHIKRLATSEEIKQYYLEQNIKKYNI